MSKPLTAQIEAVEALVSELRGLDNAWDIRRRFLSREEIREQLGELPLEGFDALAVFYQAFDLLRAEDDLGTIIHEMNSANVGGYYDLFLGQINIVLETRDHPGDRLTPVEQIVYAHEFTHALQDQHLNPQDLLWDYGLGQEGYLAVLSLIEGDAMFTQSLYAEEAAARQVTDRDLLDVLLLGENVPPSLAIPDVLRAELYMPYLNGMAFVKTLYDHGGWETVNAAYDLPPQSTEQILHPERYLAGDAPQAVPTSTVHFDDFGWDMLTEETLGEFYLRQYLGTQLTASEVDQAATGWGGDRYALYYHDRREEIAWVMNLAWDSDVDAQEFATHFKAFASRRTASESKVEAGALCWLGDDLVLCLDSSGTPSRTTVVRAPTLRAALDLLAGQG